MLFSEWLFTPAGLESVLRIRPLFREFLAQIGIRCLDKAQAPKKPIAMLQRDFRLLSGYYPTSIPNPSPSRGGRAAVEG